MGEVNHAAIRRCWDCSTVYIPEDDIGNYVFCPACKADKAFKNLKSKIDGGALEGMIKEAKKDSKKNVYKLRWRK